MLTIIVRSMFFKVIFRCLILKTFFFLIIVANEQFDRARNSAKKT